MMRAIVQTPPRGGAADLRAMRRLWQAVLVQQVTLALTGRAGGLDPVRNAHDARQARVWIGSREFHAVCALAGVDGDWIADRVARDLRLPRHARPAMVAGRGRPRLAVLDGEVVA